MRSASVGSALPVKYPLWFAASLHVPFGFQCHAAIVSSVFCRYVIGPQPAESDSLMISGLNIFSNCFAGKISSELPSALSGSNGIALFAEISTRTVCAYARFRQKGTAASSTAKRIVLLHRNLSYAHYFDLNLKKRVSSQSHYAQFHDPAKPKFRITANTGAGRDRRVLLISASGANSAAGSRRLRLLPFSRHSMSTFGLVEYEDASSEVRAVYDDIMATRKTDWINNFWKAIAHDPALLKRTWEDIKQIMAPGALDPLTKELIYVAVSVTNNCHYCIASHTASAVKKA